jgi:hypothetical protein
MTPARILRGVFARLRRPLDAFYATRHPGAFARALIRAGAPLAPFLSANDKWTLPAHVPVWMRAAVAPPLAPLPPAKRILMFTSYRGQFTLDLPLAALLAWRGHQVTIGYLPQLGSPLKPPWHDHESAAPYLEASLASLESLTGGRVRAVNLLNYADAAAPIDHAFIERQTVADAVMRVGRETLDAADSEVAPIFALYRARGELAQRVAHGYLGAAQGGFDLLLVGNGMSFEAAHVVHVAKSRSLDVVTFEKFAFRKVRMVTHGDVIFSFRDLDFIWRHRAELGLTRPAYRAAAIARGAALLQERRSGSVKNFGWKYQSADQASLDSLAQVGLAPGERFALVCPNVPFDAGYYQFTTLFGSMREWMVETVRALLEGTDLTVVVRSHPGEILHFGGRERASDNLAAAGLAGHPRLRVVAPDAAVNTYGLMQHCHCGFVFSSTTGIEMAMFGKPVVVGADVYFGRRGFTRDCADRTTYVSELRRVAMETVPAHEATRVAEEASLFYDTVHYVLQQPYPYDKAVDLIRLPPDELVRSPEVTRYLPLLDALAMTRAEFEASVLNGNSHFSIAA